MTTNLRRRPSWQNFFSPSQDSPTRGVSHLTPCVALGVRRIVYLGEVLEIKVGVDLRGCYVRVAEQFLNAAQVLAGFQQVRGEGMAEHVGVDVDAEALASAPMRRLASAPSAG